MTKKKETSSKDINQLKKKITLEELIKDITKINQHDEIKWGRLEGHEKI